MDAAMMKFATFADAVVTAGSLRDTFIAHLTALADDYNDTINSRIHYIRTGEILVEWQFGPKWEKIGQSERDQWIRRLEREKVVLPSFDVQSDAEFVSAVLRATLILRVPYFCLDVYQ